MMLVAIKLLFLLLLLMCTLEAPIELKEAPIHPQSVPANSTRTSNVNFYCPADAGSHTALISSGEMATADFTHRMLSNDVQRIATVNLPLKLFTESEV